jgi:hypothetical protein
MAKKGRILRLMAPGESPEIEQATISRSPSAVTAFRSPGWSQRSHPAKYKWRTTACCVSAADEPGIGDRVVRGAKGAPGNQGLVFLHHAHHAENLGGLDGLLKRDRRHHRRQTKATKPIHHFLSYWKAAKPRKGEDCKFFRLFSSSTGLSAPVRTG